MSSIEDIPPKRRWPRSQKFGLSALGREAEAAWREQIVASRAEGGRASYDAARTAWAERFKVQPDDGVYLGEVSATPLNLGQLVAAIEGCGKSKSDVIEALGRLVDTGLFSTVEAPGLTPR